MNRLMFLKKFLTKKRVLVGGMVVIAALVVIAIFSSLSSKPTNNPNQVSASTNTQQNIVNPTATISLNKEFDVTPPNQKNKIKYIIDTVELRPEIVIKGQKATAVLGKTFLIINLKLQNKDNTPVAVNTRDYVRLIVNNQSQETFAADIHNDPVEIQPISTKLTRIAFPVSSSDKNFKLQVGEIEGAKTTVDLNFK
ncbi:hypothetical protein HY385_00605 [Candidatus Daviesbacteria bacterium]|nr:hypothetical protein [Candidatus Daviesbacteria bacterium]